MKALRKRQGFEGQKLIVLPKKIMTEFLTKDPVPTYAPIRRAGPADPSGS